MADSCVNCSRNLITDAEFKAMKPTAIGGQMMMEMDKYYELAEARNSLGVACAECDATFCVHCMEQEGKPHPTTGGLGCLDCGGKLKQYVRS